MPMCIQTTSSEEFISRRKKKILLVQEHCAETAGALLFNAGVVLCVFGPRSQ